jgi:hypothetical protein
MYRCGICGSHGGDGDLIFWDTTICNLVDTYRYFRRICLMQYVHLGYYNRQTGRYLQMVRGVWKVMPP